LCFHVYLVGIVGCGFLSLIHTEIKLPLMNTIHFLLNEQKTHLKFYIHRAKALNAINFEVMSDLEEVLDIAESLPLNVFELQTNENGYVASGGDLKEFSALISEDQGFEMANRMAAILNRIENLNCITVASVTGTAFGGGCELVLAFDLVYATEDAKLGFTQIKFGLPPGWNGMARLINRIGYHKSLHVLLNGKLIKAVEAKQLGIITELFDSIDQIDKQINYFEKIPLVVIHSIKHNALLYKNHSNQDELKKEELRRFARAWASDEHYNAVDLFFKSRE